MASSWSTVLLCSGRKDAPAVSGLLCQSFPVEKNVIGTDEIKGLYHEALTAEQPPHWLFVVMLFLRSRDGTCTGPLVNFKALIDKRGTICVNRRGDPINSVSMEEQAKDVRWFTNVALFSISLVNNQQISIEQDDTVWSMHHDQQRYTLHMRS